MNQLKVCNKQYFLPVKIVVSLWLQRQYWNKKVILIFLPSVCFSSAYTGKKNLFIFHKWKIKILIKVLVPFIVNALANTTSVWLVVCPCMFLHLMYILCACLHKDGFIQNWVKKWEIPLVRNPREIPVSAGGGTFLRSLWNSFLNLKESLSFLSWEGCLIP